MRIVSAGTRTAHTTGRRYVVYGELVTNRSAVQTISRTAEGRGGGGAGGRRGKRRVNCCSRGPLRHDAPVKQFIIRRVNRAVHNRGERTSELRYTENPCKREKKKKNTSRIDLARMTRRITMRIAWSYTRI